MSNAASLGKAIHAVTTWDIHPPICGFVVEVIFLYHFLWNVAELDLGKFGLF
jgi:hypothetical protein